LEPLQEIIKDEKKIHLGSCGVHEQVEDGKEVLNQHNSGPELNTVLNTIINKFEYLGLKEAVKLLNTHLISQSNTN